jgi:hypothetical protein
VSVTVQLSPQLDSLAKAIGLVGADGHVDAAWFDAPLERLSTVLSNPNQRAALLELVEELLPSTPPGGANGSVRWHPLLDPAWRGNVYLTVDGDVIGVAAGIETPSDISPGARASIRLPLIDLSSGTPEVIAGTAKGPLEVTVRAAWDPAAHPSGASVHASVDLQGKGGLLISFEDLDPDAAPGNRTDLDPARIDAGAMRVLSQLVNDVVAQLPGVDPHTARVAAHLPGVLGIDPQLEPLPLHDLFSNPDALRTWFAAIAATSATLKTWFTHLAGMLGSGLPAPLPTVSGIGTAVSPYRAQLVDLGSGSELQLTVGAADPSAGPPALLVGVAVALPTPLAKVESAATLFSLPLDGSSPVTLLPSAHLALNAPTTGTIVDQQPTVKLGAVSAGFAWNGVQIAPHLELVDVVIAGKPYARLDLTNANAVGEAAIGAIGSELDKALGTAGLGRALQALIGLVPPSGDTTSPHTLSFTTLVTNPTRAIAEVHRAALADPAHPWKHLLEELATLLQLTSGVDGDGTLRRPWAATIASLGLARLQIVAWNARDASTAADTQLLRLGLRVGFDEAPWSGGWVAELLAFDLPDGAPAQVAFLGGQHLTLSVAPGALPITAAGLALALTRVSAELSWVPGTSPGWELDIDDLVVIGSGDTVGPVTFRFPGAGFDPDAPDLGLGIPAGTLMALLRLLLSQALHDFGGSAAVTVGALLGLHRGLRGLPADWPLLAPPVPSDLGSLFGDPLGVIRAQLERVAFGSSADGTPFLIAALPWVVALLQRALPDRVNDALASLVPDGFGTREVPWAAPILDRKLELLCWLEPDGPPEAWQRSFADRLAQAVDGISLVALLGEIAPLVPEVDAAIHARGQAWAGAQLERLAEWLARGDGLVQSSAQVVIGATWQTGAPVVGAHHDQPPAADAIAQIEAQLQGWSGGAPAAVLLIGPAFTDHRTWNAYLQSAEPGRAAEAHFDLRVPGADPLTLDLDHVTAVATHYTADLADGPVAAQLQRLVGRIQALTGQSKIYLVAHSTAGVAARAFAAANPALVAGVITLGTPHAPSPIAPLADEGLAEAVRFAEALQPATGRSDVGRAIGHLAEALDGSAGYGADAFAGGTGAQDVVQGLAIPGWLGTALFDDLASDLAQRARDAATGAVPATHFAVGARLQLDLPAAEAGEIAVLANVRVDAARFALGGAASAMVRPAQAVDLRIDVLREGDGWLVGGPGPETPLRLRRAEIGATVEPAEGGGIRVKPRFLLHEVGAPVRASVDLVEALSDPAAIVARLPLSSARPASGSAPALLVDLLQAFGAIATDGSGALALAVDELAAIASRPMERLGPRLPAALDVLAAFLGATRIGDSWMLQLAAAPIELAVAQNPWSLSVRTHDPATGAATLELAPGFGVGIEAATTLPAFAATATAQLSLGEAILTWSSAAGTLTLSDSSSPAPLTLLPSPPAEVLRAELARRLPGIAISGVLSGVLSALAGGSVRVRGIGRLLRDPGGWVLSPDGLGTASGDRLDATRVAALLDAAGRALGLQTAGGISLPAGLTLAVAGPDPVTFTLDGGIALGTGTDELRLQLGLGVGQNVAVTPSGNVTLSITMPGNWGKLAVTAGVDPSGLLLSVAPTGAPVIQLLPHFSGFGALAAGASMLLPRILQAVVDEVAPQPQLATGLLRAALSLAKALGFYDFDAQGFEAPGRSAEFAKVLQPGWLESKFGSAPAITQVISQLFTGPTPLVDIPGTVTASGATVQWAYVLPIGGTVTASLGWTGAGAAAEPSLLIGVQDLELGPVIADELSAGYDQGLSCHLALHLDPGGALSFLQPALDFDVVGESISVEAYPLGVSEKADFAVLIAPSPELVLHPQAAVALIERWGLPLVAQLLVREFEAELEKSLWAAGPTARSVLEQAGVLKAGVTPPELASPLPKPEDMALRALKALVSNVTIEIVADTLWMSLVEDSGRRGIRLRGRQDVGAGDIDVGLRFGDADWLDDPAAGVTLWLLEDAAGMPPVKVTPALDVTGLGIVLSRTDGDPLVEGAFQIGAAGGFLFFDLTFLDANRVVALGVSKLGAGLEIDEAQINVSSDDSDSFLKKVLPKELQAPFDLAVAYREGDGLTIYGGAPGGGLELTFPLDLDLVVLRIEELFLALRAQSGTASLEAALTGRADLGPLHASVQRVGIKVTFASGEAKLGFRAPDGIGLSIDAGPVGGGGFLFIDEPKGQYAGALQLKLQTLSLTAIGLLNTKMPDGSPIPGPGGLPGFSLLVIIAVEFPPIQLGFGFTLNGIGGILGLNRTINVEALRAGVRTRALDAMLFPPDPIANAAAVVRTLTTVFPVAPDRFVIGPMVRLGWGTPPILTLDLAILIELPAPIRIAILGRIALALPQDAEEAVVSIHMDVVGIVDFDKGEVSIDAVLYDSLIAGFSLTGGMALRARWKNDPTFIVSIGGFHPSFQPPPGFPALDRIALSLATGDNPRLRFETYLAVTSNTVQFGAHIDLHAEAAGFAIDGNLSFDALIQFDPFGLMADMAGSFSVTHGGDTICSVGVEVHLTGPSPWHVWGHAHIQVLFLSATVGFDAHFGEEALPPPPPPVRVSDLLFAAIAEPANWSAQPPAGEGVVSLRALLGSDEILAHPLGALTFRQRTVPLELTLARYGSAQIDGATRFEIADVRCGTRTIPAADREDVRDAFAPAQFLPLTDDEKLSRPSFEPFVSGVSLRFDGYQVDDLAAGEAAPLGYEVIVVDAEEDGSAPDSLTFAAADAVGLARTGPAAASPARRAALRRFGAAPAATVQVDDARFGVVTSGSAAPVATAHTFTEAAEEARKLGGNGARPTVVGLRDRAVAR